MRPLSTEEQLAKAKECISYAKDEPRIIVGTDRSFTFDYVYPSCSTQEALYAGSITPLLDRFSEGYAALDDFIYSYYYF